MSSSSCFQVHMAVPLPKCGRFSLFVPSIPSLRRNAIKDRKASARMNAKLDDGKEDMIKKGGLGIQMAAIWAVVEHPALAITGVNNQEDLFTILTQSALIAFWYFIIMPPIIMNWVRIRFYRRKLLEMYLQFMCIFVFFPGVMLWAPFLNFRKLPRDPSMQYPWSPIKDPSKIKQGYRKYPYATPEDYD